MSWIEAIRLAIDWIKNNSLAIGIWAYQRLLSLLGKEQQLRNKAELETKKLENKIAIDNDNSNKSDVDIVADAIREGRES